jgi:UPF0716 protein FxsA
MPFLFVFFALALPVIEFALFAEVSRAIGLFPAVLLILAGSAFGAYLLRSQSLIIGRRAFEAMQAGTPPEQALVDGGAVMLSGVLFAIPGFFTDILAALLLLPLARRAIWRGVSFGVQRKAAPSSQTHAWSDPPSKPHRSQDVIDVEFTEVPPDTNGNPGHKDSPWSKP